MIKPRLFEVVSQQSESNFPDLAGLKTHFYLLKNDNFSLLGLFALLYSLKLELMKKEEKICLTLSVKSSNKNLK